MMFQNSRIRGKEGPNDLDFCQILWGDKIEVV